jgi:hypothetical protein
MEIGQVCLRRSGYRREQRHRAGNHPGAGRGRLERHRDRSRRPETAESLREIADELSGLELRTLDVTSDESVDSCIHSILTDLGVASSRP